MLKSNHKRRPEILVVDSVSKKQEHVVPSVPGGEMALEYLQTDFSGLILLATRLPGMDGYPVCALGENDSGCAAFLAHTLKGMAGNIGVEDLQAATDALESALKQGNDPSLEKLLEQVAQSLARATSSIAKLKSQDSETRPVEHGIVDGQDNLDRAAFAAGAQGYILRMEGSLFLLQVIRVVTQGGFCSSPSLAKRQAAPLTAGVLEKRSNTLTIREWETLAWLAKGYTNRKIALKMNIAETTVRFHLRNIYRKLKLNRGEALAWAVHIGLGDKPE